LVILLLVVTPVARAVPPEALGDVTVTEIQADPTRNAQYYAEWFELYNNSGKTLDMNGVLIETANGSFTIAGPPIVVGVGDYLVLGVSSDTGINGGVGVDYVYDFGDVNLEGPDDRVKVSYEGVTLDDLDWDSSWSFTPDNAMACAPNASANEWANDLPGNWCPSQVFMASGMYGSPGEENEYCGEEPNVDNDGDGYAEFEGDCNDEDVTVHPDAIDGLEEPHGEANDDADCDGVRDDGATDDDGDGWTEVAGDCDDDDINTYPGAIETYDGEDDDCDGCVDDVDEDQDGWTECLEACDSDGDGDIDDEDIDCKDCNDVLEDGGANQSPDRPEVPYDGIDQDCDGFEYCDVDGDGYEASADYGPGCDGFDCDDANADVHPGAPEDNGNGIDDDCDGVIDIPDKDGDGFTAQDGDCMDLGPEDPEGYSDAQIVLSAAVFPGATEACFDLVDNDCDGWIDNAPDCDRVVDAATVRGGGLCGVVDGGASLLAAAAGLVAIRRRSNQGRRATRGGA